MISNTDYPKVLIIGQSFSRSHGGGITLINLFKGWPEDSVAVVTIGHYMESLDASVCSRYYCMGSANQKKMFPLNLLQRKFPSGPVDVRNDKPNTVNTYASKEKKVRNFLVMKVLYPVLEYLGLYHVSSKLVTDEQLLGWINEFKPDYFYSQLASLEVMRFVSLLEGKFNKPVVIHIMDDWPTTIVKPGMLSFYWKKRLDAELRKILSKAKVKLAISAAMKEEYEKRYGGNWDWFCNPIELADWMPFRKTDSAITGIIKIGYTGRIGLGTLNSLQAMEQAMDLLAGEGIECEFHLYTPDHKTLEADVLRKNRHIVVHSPVAHSEMPAVLTGFDLLFLPLDFDAESLRFVRFSLPTKASEFMISGVPILVFADSSTGLSKYAASEHWAVVVNRNGVEDLAEGLRKAITDRGIREKIVRNAERTANSYHNAVAVRERFRLVFK